MASKTTSTVINLGSQRVSLASIVGGSKGSLALTRYFVHDLEGDPSSDATRIPQLQIGVRSVVEQAKLKGSQVRCAIAGQPVFMRFVKLPPLSEDKVDQIVEFEAQQNVPFPINEVAWGYQLIGESGSPDVEVLLAAIKSDELSAMNAAVERAGLTTVSVDVAPMLIYNAYRFNYADQKKPALILDVGARTANLIYVEPGRVFISSSRIGGASFTQALAKEMEIPFEAAEHLKLQKGSLNVGQDHAGDEQAGMVSSILRNAVTRLHGEIVRTNNRYKSQQEGNLPEVVYLAGRASGTPYLAQFLQEKLGVPVEYFNPLRNVAIGPKVNQEQVAAEAHTMGELVGLALRNGDQSPIELELVPESLAAARDLEKRKPALVLAATALLLALAAGVFYYTRATQVIDGKISDLEEEASALEIVQNGIGLTTRELEEVQRRTEPFIETVLNRVYWVNFLEDLNSRVTSKEVWFTQLRPRIGDRQLTRVLEADPFAALGARDLDRLRDADRGRGDSEDAGPLTIDSVELTGLFRSPARPTIVSEVLYNELRKSSYFNFMGVNDEGDPAPLSLSEIISNIDEGNDEAVWAYNFEIVLPLKEPVVIE